MLFVDDGEAEPVESHGFLDEGVRPHGEMRLSGGDRGKASPLLPRRQTSREQRHRHGKVAEKGRNRAGMLLRQNLGGGHQRRLEARVDGTQRGEERYDRLSGADVTLDESVHRAGRGHILPDFAKDPYLGAG